MARTTIARYTRSWLLGWILLCWAGTVPAAPIESRHLQSLGAVDYHALPATGLSRTFHVFVDLPEAYADSNRRFPAVYLLDGGNTFPLLAAYHHYLRFGDEAPPVLLVGISYGADTFREGNWRASDFTAPAAEPEYWGGAAAFQGFLADQLIPLIEQRYRADPSRRILFGHSLGGQFVLYTALTKPTLFAGHIASNPVLHRNLPFFTAWRGEGALPNEVTRLFVGLAQFERPELSTATLAWREAWDKRPRRPWAWTVRELPGHTHFSAVPESFRRGLPWVLSSQGGD